MTRPARRLLSHACAVLAVVVLAGCDNFPHLERIGASLSPDGETIQIHYVVCSDQLITELTIVDSSNTDLWRIASEQGSDQELYAVGSTPDDFDELVPLSADLDDHESYVVVVETTMGTATLDLVPADLNSTQVVNASRDVMEREAFRERVDRSC